jgi:hypothetical protein
VVITVIAVLVMQAAIHQAVDVITVRHSLVTATGAMNMARIVTGAALAAMAAVRILIIDLNEVVVDMVAVRVMSVAIVQVADVIANARAAPPCKVSALADAKNVAETVHGALLFRRIDEREPHRLPPERKSRGTLEDIPKDLVLPPRPLQFGREVLLA